MAFLVHGKVRDVEVREYNGRETFDAFIADNPSARAERVSGPLALLPTVGETVTYRVSAKARTYADKVSGEIRAFVSLWVLDRAQAQE